MERHFLQRFSWGVALTSGASLALSLLSTRIFSVTMFYHFAFLLVSLAMLGIAVAGVAIYLLPRVFAPDRRLLLAAGFAIAMGPLALLAMHVTVGNPLELNLSDENRARLFKLYLATSAPFIASGFAISLAIASAGKNIGRVYAFDLIGAAVGCAAIIPLTPALSAPGVIVLVGAVSALGGALMASASEHHPKHRRVVAAVGCVVAAALLVGVLPKTQSREWFRFAQGSKFLQEATVEYERWNAFSRVTVSTGTDDYKWIMIDGDAATAIWRREFIDPNHRADEHANKLNMLVYGVRNEGPALVIGPGGGPDVLWALRQGVPRVIGVEVNPLIANDVMRGAYRSWNGGLYDDPRVRIVVDDGRSFVRGSHDRYSTIQATLVDTWAASASGAFTLSENSLYTLEAFTDYLDHLKDNGILSLTRWSGPQLRRTLTLARAALSRRGVRDEDHRRHIYIAGAASCATVLIKVTPFTEDELDRYDAFAQRIEAFPIYRNGRSYPAHVGSAGLVEQPLAQVIASDPQDISAVTDDRPFFFFNVKTSEFYTLLSRIGTIQSQDIGLVLLQLILLLSVAFTLLLVVAPLALFRRGALHTQRTPKLLSLAYFACLGLGFILVELGLMQRFILFLGHPIYSLSVVLATLLLSSGVGSSLTPRLVARFGVQGAARRVAFTLVGVLLVYAVLLRPLFASALGLPLWARIAIAATLVAGIGVQMGTLLPLGVTTANRLGPDVSAWGWGVNGATSVVGATVSMAVSINYGFSATLMVGVASYAFAGVVIGAIRAPEATLDEQAAS